jgi:hypothetical protein
MNIFKVIQDAVQYVVEAATRLFSPSDDECPDIGVQPYDGDTNPE